jgi:hypothetical protein
MTNNRSVSRGYRIKHERALVSAIPIEGVRIGHVSNKTPVARVHGKIKLKCPICLIEFERYACHVVRRTRFQKASYCSRACLAIGNMKPVERHCVVCNKTYSIPYSSRNRVVTCSNECLRTKRTKKFKQSLDSLTQSS